MKNLKNLLTISPFHVPKWMPWVILAVALIGFSDATYVTVKHYQGLIPPCSIGGCETVLSSSFSEIAGVPVSLLGAIFYFIIALSLFVFFDSKKPIVKEISFKFVIFSSIFGFLASLYFMTVMIFVLKAFCPYCVVSAITSLTIFTLSMYAVHINYHAKV